MPTVAFTVADGTRAGAFTHQSLVFREYSACTMRLPDGWHCLTPRIVTDDVVGLVEFLRRAFGATGEIHADRPTVMRIGDSMLMLSSAGLRASMPAFLYLYVDDADATYRRALEAGGRSLEEPIDTPYGDRRAMVDDRWGNVWQIATFAKAVPPSGTAGA
jgi:uncharacterized glyoxalase superfamily protein PhnB